MSKIKTGKCKLVMPIILAINLYLHVDTFISRLHSKLLSDTFLKTSIYIIVNSLLSE